MGVDEDKDEERMSWIKSVLFMERKRRTRLVVRMFLAWGGAETEKRMARWSERAGSVESMAEIMVDEE